MFDVEFVGRIMYTVNSIVPGLSHLMPVFCSLAEYIAYSGIVKNRKRDVKVFLIYFNTLTIYKEVPVV